MTRSWSHAARTIDAVPLYRLRIEAQPVDALRFLALPGSRRAALEGVAEIHLDADDGFEQPEHRLRWRPQADGTAVRLGWADPPRGESPDPRTRDVLRRLDRGEVGRLAGDPVSLLAAEIRRLRGES